MMVNVEKLEKEVLIMPKLNIMKYRSKSKIKNDKTDREDLRSV